MTIISSKLSTRTHYSVAVSVQQKQYITDGIVETAINCVVDAANSTSRLMSEQEADIHKVYERKGKESANNNNNNNNNEFTCIAQIKYANI